MYPALTFGLILMAGVYGLRSFQMVPASSEDLIALERKYQQAVDSGDLKTQADLLADDYVFVTAFGAVMDKTRRLDANRGLKPNLAGAKSWNAEDVRVQRNGNTAVITMKSTIKGVLTQGDRAQDITGEYRTIRVWTIRAGRWQAISGQQTALPGTRPNLKCP